MRLKQDGLLLVVSGPAGVGKGTIDTALIARHPEIKMSVSATTRKPRTGETDGVHYFFKTPEAFRQMIEQNAFLEYMHVFGMHYYGTPRAYVEAERKKGNHVILEIDVQGARKVKEACPDAVLIFIAPPSMETLHARLIGRGTESDEAIRIRTQTAFSEMQQIPFYDYVVVNDLVEDAVRQMEAIIDAELCATARNQEQILTLIGGNTL